MGGSGIFIELSEEKVRSPYLFSWEKYYFLIIEISCSPTYYYTITI